MAKGNRVDFDPVFIRDAQKILDSYREEKKTVAAENTEEYSFDEIDPTTEKPVETVIDNSDDIVDLPTFRNYIDNISEIIEKVDERTETLLENLSDFNITMPESLYDEMRLLKGYAGTDNPTKEEVLNFTQAQANCVAKVLTRGINEFNQKVQDPEKMDAAIQYTVADKFPKFGLSFLFLLIIIAVKAAMWNVFQTLCVELRKVRIKVGPFKFCLGCPIAKVFRAVVAWINSRPKWGSAKLKIREANQVQLKNGKYIQTSMWASYVDEIGDFAWWGDMKHCPRDTDGSYVYESYAAYAKSHGLCAECPPKYSFTMLQQEKLDALESIYSPDRTSQESMSVCASDTNPTPEELAAAKAIEAEIIKMQASQNPQDSKAAAYLSAKKDWGNIRDSAAKTVMNSVETNDPKTADAVKNKNILEKTANLFELGKDDETNKSDFDQKHKLDAISNIKDLRAVLAANKGDTDAAVNSVSSSYEDNFLDGTTKAMLQVAMGMLKVWDGAVSAINNIYTTCPLEKDLICCLLNAFTAVLLDINGPTASADWQEAQRKAKAVILFVLRFIKILLDLRVGRLATELEASFVTLDGLLSSIQNAIIESFVTIGGPYIDKLSKDFHKFLSLKQWNEDCVKKTAEVNEKYQTAKREYDTAVAQANASQSGAGSADLKTYKDNLKRAEGEVYFRKKLCEAKLNCKPLNFLLSLADCELAKLKVQFMDWLIGLKLKTNDSASLIELKINQSSEAKLMFIIGEILDGMIDSLEKGFEGFFSFCSGNNDLNPFGVPTIDQALSTNSLIEFREDGTAYYKYENPWKQLPPPVFDPTKNVGIEEDDPVDTAFNTESSFYHPKYTNMPEYKQFINPIDDKIDINDEAIAGDIYVTEIPSTDNIDKKLDETYRDCSSDERVRILFDMLMKANNF